MIELIFNDCGAASLALAQNAVNAEKICCAEIQIDDAGTETVTQMAPVPYPGPYIGGTYADIASPWLLLDVGDLSALPDMSPRKEILRLISDVYGMVEGDEWIDEAANGNAQIIARLKAAAKSGESVRVWWSDAPGEVCGYFWAMSLLQDAAGPVTSVKVPAIWPGEAKPRPIGGIGDLTPADIYALHREAQPVLPDERRRAAGLWERLVGENAPLRAVTNGEPHSVPEDYYDPVIRSACPEGEVLVAMLVGRAMTTGPAGVHDWWYAARIRRMVQDGAFTLVKQHRKFYHCTVIRNRM